MKKAIGFTVGASLVLAVALGGCDKLGMGGKDKTPDAGTATTPTTTETPTATTVATTEPTATAPASADPKVAPPSGKPFNEREVKRYKDEKELTGSASVESSIVTVREEARLGSEHVATLKKGESVTKLGEKSGFTLVSFPDAADSSRTLIGWISNTAFAPEKVDAGVIPRLVCTNGLQPMADEVKDFCAVICTKDETCLPSQACHGEGRLRVNFAPVHFCKVGERFKPEPPPTPVVDAGPPPATVDAAPPPPATVDAAPPPPKGNRPPNGVIRIATDASCPAGYTRTTGLCRWACQTLDDCHISDTGSNPKCDVLLKVCR